MLKSKDKLGDYEIVARLKAGGMAQVYLARRKGAAGFTRPVALKVIHPHLASEEEFVRMFVDEATLSSRIEAPNVVHIEELGQLDGMWFQAMEYVHGASLAQVVRALRLAGRRCTPELAVHIVAEIASGLHAAHQTTDAAGMPLGIVHRDVSPQNVLVSYRGNVKVCDFGIAKALRRVAKDDVLQGKIAYMPPEQARGEDVDRRADLYALGVVLWELLVLERMVDAGSEMALLHKARNPEVVRPSTRVSGIPPALDDVVMKVLARAAQDRPATAAEMRRLLLDAVPGARRVENEDVAALLRAVMKPQIEEQATLLPLVSEGTLHLEMPASRQDDVRPDDALRHLTVPAVVMPSSSPRPGAAALAKRSGASWGTPTLVAIAVVAVLTSGLAIRLALDARARPAAVTADVSTAPPPADEAATLAPPPAEPPPALASATPPIAPTVMVSAGLGRPRRAPSRPPSARPPASGAKPACRKVGGVELCE